MQLFYAPDLPNQTALPTDEAHHAVRVLRMRVGDELWATDGKGNRYRTQVAEASAKQCTVTVLETIPSTKTPPRLHLAIAPTKNLDRMEWMIEKAVEIGITEIHFLLTEHSERKVLKMDRLERKALSAMKQSLKDFYPTLQPLVAYHEWLEAFPTGQSAFIAHLAGPETPHLFTEITAGHPTWVLVGPEGGFSEAEVEQAQAKGIRPVLLGAERLRTETAGLAASQMVALKNELE